MPRNPDPKSKAGFVRAQPSTLSAAAIVAKGKASGIKLSESYVYNVRGKANAKAKAAKSGAPAKRGPGRPRKVTGLADDGHVGNGIEAEIERIVEAKVNALLKSKLGALFSG